MKPRYGKVKTPSPGCRPQEDFSVITRIEGEESLPMPEGRGTSAHLEYLCYTHTHTKISFSVFGLAVRR